MEDEKMKATIYHCKTATEANDRANLYYISVNAASGMRKDHERRTIEITNKRKTIIAVFAY